MPCTSSLPPILVKLCFIIHKLGFSDRNKSINESESKSLLSYIAVVQTCLEKEKEAA